MKSQHSFREVITLQRIYYSSSTSYIIFCCQQKEGLPSFTRSQIPLSLFNTAIPRCNLGRSDQSHHTDSNLHAPYSRQLHAGVWEHQSSTTLNAPISSNKNVSQLAAMREQIQHVRRGLNTQIAASNQHAVIVWIWNFSFFALFTIAAHQLYFFTQQITL